MALKRFVMMALTRKGEAVQAEELAALLDEHLKFLKAGGAGGSWETLCTTSDLETGLVLGIYRGGTKKGGKQADLSMRLVESDLNGANLSFANLLAVGCTNRNWDEINLEGALLVDSDLRGTSFRKANLRRADFSRSDMQGCDLSGADLRDTDFEEVNLSAANLTGALVTGTRFVNTCLDGVIGLGGQE